MDPRSSAEPALPPIRADAMCLGLITFVTALPYVGKLGFYSDNWYELWSFQTFGFQALLRDYADRPLQGLYLISLYKLFGFHPLGYHLVNTTVIAATMPLFYWLLMRLKVDRPTALAATVVLIVLPQLSTVRVWYATFQIPLAMAAALASLHCQLSFARSRRLGWAAAAALTAIASIAAYEIFAPLIAAFPAYLMATEWDRRGADFRKEAAALVGLVLLVGLLALAKYAISPRPQPPDLHRYVKGAIQLFRPDYDWRTDYALNIFAAATVHFWWPAVGLFRGVQALVQGRLGWLAAAAALAVASLTFWRLRSSASTDSESWTNPRLLLLGIAVFLLGHGAFLIVPAMNFSPTGIANRALVTAALGVALILVAALRFAVGRRPQVFASVIAAVAFFGTLRILDIETYWTEAPAIEAKVLTAARADLQDVPAQSFVMLDNVCPYHGPAVIFEAPWDVSGALSLVLGKTVRGDAVSPRMTLQPGGLATSIYGDKAFYPYGSNLYVYDPARHRLAQLRDFAAARRYFIEANATRTPCPRGYVGHGVLI